MPPSYESQSFWEDRFKKEDHFEWLGGGQETIIPVLRPYLQNHAEVDPERVRPPLLLHIGAGTSTLSGEILEEYQRIYQKPFTSPVVLNTDFAFEAVRRGTQATEGSQEVMWRQLDLLSWKNMLLLRDEVWQTEGRRFMFVVDKSTTDAISCQEDMVFGEETFGSSPGDIHPLILSIMSTSSRKHIQIHPVAVLALHLASHVEAGGVWIVLSYSSNRFPFLSNEQNLGNKDEGRELDVGVFWKLERVEAVKVREGEVRGTVHAPDVFHYLYILRRTDAVVTME